jgi:hypothetical protein
VLETDACEHCRRTEGERYVIRDPHQGVAAHVLHEKCAPDFYHSEVPPDHEV